MSIGALLYAVIRSASHAPSAAGPPEKPSGPYARIGSLTAVDPDPRGDQADARLRDLTRLIELAGPHMPDRAGPVADALPRMNPADRAELQAILDRLGDITETPVKTGRQQILLHLAELETHVRDVLKEGRATIRNGKVLLDPATGKPLRNRNVDRSARATLRKIQRLTFPADPPAGPRGRRKPRLKQR